MDESILLAAVTALVLSWLVQPHFRSLGFLTGIVDHPGYRRSHRKPVPRTGGMAIFISFFVTLYILDTFVLQDPLPWTWLGALGGAGLGIMALGVGDDRFHIHAEKKLYGQLIVILGLMIVGERLEEVTLPLIGTIALGGWAWPVTLLWYLGFVNSMNLIDGLDGLASGVGLVVSITIAVVAFALSDYYSLLFSSALGGAIIAFIYWNMSSRKIFLGDSGSMWLGLALGGLLMHLAQHRGVPLLLLLAPMLVPIWDTGTTIIRRYRKRTSIFEADDYHLHHRMVRLGFSPIMTVILLMLTSIGAVLFALSDFMNLAWLGLPAMACWMWPLSIWSNRRNRQEGDLELDFFSEMLFVVGLDDLAESVARPERRQVAEIIDIQVERNRVAKIVATAGGTDEIVTEESPDTPSSDESHVVFTHPHDPQD
jgi:UDP-GlcNAc:undecaprenyl-phosphate/decaprenyl-phosphate GlcNAc-1-phosphate transferase